jgi:hypothetical protein
MPQKASYRLTGALGLLTMPPLKLCTILLYAEGYKAERTLQHYRTIQAFPFILGSERKKDSNYLDACRSKRNIVEYDYVGGVTENDADELIGFVRELKDEIETWLEEKHPELASKAFSNP